MGVATAENRPGSDVRHTTRRSRGDGFDVAAGNQECGCEYCRLGGSMAVTRSDPGSLNISEVTKMPVDPFLYISDRGLTLREFFGPRAPRM